MSALTRIDLDELLCRRCHWSRIHGWCTCGGDLEVLAAQVQRRHEISVLRAAYRAPDPLPPAPDRRRWVLAPTARDVAHLIGTGGRASCGKVRAGLGSRPAQDGARWCRLCANATTGVDS